MDLDTRNCIQKTVTHGFFIFFRNLRKFFHWNPNPKSCLSQIVQNCKDFEKAFRLHSDEIRTLISLWNAFHKLFSFRSLRLRMPCSRFLYCQGAYRFGSWLSWVFGFLFRCNSKTFVRAFLFLRNTSGSPGGGDGADKSRRSGIDLGSTRIWRLVSALRQELLKRWNTVRLNFPAKVFLLLFGFFCSNALATILG